eukprot:15120266-Heterocapsa_arctica.AAC.1
MHAGPSARASRAPPPGHPWRPRGRCSCGPYHDVSHEAERVGRQAVDFIHGGVPLELFGLPRVLGEPEPCSDVGELVVLQPLVVPALLGSGPLELQAALVGVRLPVSRVGRHPPHLHPQARELRQLVLDGPPQVSVLALGPCERVMAARAFPQQPGEPIHYRK